MDAADDVVEAGFEWKRAHDAPFGRPHLDVGDPEELHSALRIEVDDAKALEPEQLASHLEIAQVHVVDDRVERLPYGRRLVGCLESGEEGRRAFAVVDQVDPAVGEVAIVEAQAATKGSDGVNAKLHRLAVDDRVSVRIIDERIFDDRVPKPKLRDVTGV